MAAYTIDLVGAHPTDPEIIPGNFNGYTIEDTNGTLPDILSVTVDTSVSTHSPVNILVSPNSIWLDFEGTTFPSDSFIRLNATFADKPSTPHLSLTASPSGNMILEGPAKVGSQYQFEQSEDLENHTSIDKILTAETPFVMTFIKPTESNMFYRLREVE